MNDAAVMYGGALSQPLRDTWETHCFVDANDVYWDPPNQGWDGTGTIPFGLLRFTARVEILAADISRVETLFATHPDELRIKWSSEFSMQFG